MSVWPYHCTYRSNRLNIKEFEGKTPKAETVRVQNVSLLSARIVMSAVNSDDFGSLIAFTSQLIFVLHDNLIPSHDCLNPIGINRRCAKKSKAGNCLRP